MSMRDSDDDGGLVRDGATQTGRAVLLIVVAIVVAVVLLHHNNSTPTLTSSTNTTTPAKAQAPTSGGGTGGTTPRRHTAPKTTTTTVPVAQVKVLVLNGDSFAQPYATAWTNKLKTSGYSTLSPENATAAVKATAVYVLTPGFTSEGQALASSLGLPPTVVQTNVPSGTPLPSTTASSGANLVLVIGPDLVAKGVPTTPAPPPAAPTTAAPAPPPAAAPTTAAPPTTAPPAAAPTTAAPPAAAPTTSAPPAP